MLNRIFKFRPKYLAIVNHYFGKTKDFNGGSNYQKADIRREYVKEVIDELKKLESVEVKVCGLEGNSLVKIDKDFSHIKDPAFLVYESIEWMFSQIDKYDYFINIEEDVLLDRETFERIVEFDKQNPVNECFHPNRMEYENGEEYCVDLRAMPGWTNKKKKYLNYDLRVAKNPHSGLSILSKEKILYARERVNLKRRDKIIGHYMASAYANLHEPFLLYRSYPDISAHKVIHLDKWEAR